MWMTWSMWVGVSLLKHVEWSFWRRTCKYNKNNNICGDYQHCNKCRETSKEDDHNRPMSIKLRWCIHALLCHTRVDHIFDLVGVEENNDSFYAYWCRLRWNWACSYQYVNEWGLCYHVYMRGWCWLAICEDLWRKVSEWESVTKMPKIVLRKSWWEQSWDWIGVKQSIVEYIEACWWFIHFGRQTGGGGGFPSQSLPFFPSSLSSPLLLLSTIHRDSYPGAKYSSFIKKPNTTSNAVKMF